MTPKNVPYARPMTLLPHKIENKIWENITKIDLNKDHGIRRIRISRSKDGQKPDVF